MGQANSIVGQIEVGDAVRTLNRKKGVEGRVTKIKKAQVFITGTEYPGGPEVKCQAHIESVALVRKGGPNE